MKLSLLFFCSFCYSKDAVSLALLVKLAYYEFQLIVSDSKDTIVARLNSAE